MSKEDLKVKPVEQEVTIEDQKKVYGGECKTYCPDDSPYAGT